MSDGAVKSSSSSRRITRGSITEAEVEMASFPEEDVEAAAVVVAVAVVEVEDK